MPQHTIQVIARITAQAGNSHEVHSLLQAIVAPTRQESGCLNYRLYRNRNDPAVFVFIEEWSDEQAIIEHFRQPYIQAVFSKALPLLAEPPQIEQYELLV